MPKNKFILSLDAGTTGVQASLFHLPDMTMHGNNKVEFTQIFPHSGFVEHNPQEIWEAFLKAIRMTIEKTAVECPGFLPEHIVSVGITNQRETCLAWNKVTGEIAMNAIVWQDRRTHAFCDELKKNESIRTMVLQKTGLVCDPYFSASKLKWMRENVPQVKRWEEKKELAFGTIDCFLIWKLTGGRVFATEHTNASRTMLYNLNTAQYDPELLKMFSIAEHTLPEIRPSVGSFGATHGVSVLPDGIPICGVLGDQQSALFGQSGFSEGEAKITFGTGAFLLMNVGEKPIYSDTGLLSTVAFSSANKRMFALEGSAFIAGAAIQFLRDNFGFIQNSREISSLAAQTERDPELFFVPALSGLGAPYWNANAKGVLFGMHRGTQRSHIARAVLESIALQNVQLFNLMQQASGVRLARVGVDGGVSKNDDLMQFQSDLLQTTLVRPKNIETTSRGAALAARCGLLNEMPTSDGNVQDIQKVFTHSFSQKTANQHLEEWLRAVECVHHFYLRQAPGC